MNKETITRLAAKLALKRSNMGLTQEQFSNRFDIPLRTLQRLEKNDFNKISDKTLDRVCVALLQLEFNFKEHEPLLQDA